MDRGDKLSPRQFKYLLMTLLAGSSIAFLPRLVAEIAGRAGWLLVLLSGLLALLHIRLLMGLADCFHNESMLTWLAVRFPWLARLVGFIYMFIFLFSTSLDLRLLAEGVRLYLLPVTPVMVSVLLAALLLFYLAGGGISLLGRLAELLLPFVYGGLLAILLLSISRLQLSQVLPWPRQGWLQFLAGVYLPFQTWLGYEGLLLFWSRQEGRPGTAPVLKGDLMTIMLFTLFTLVSAGVLGSEELTWVEFPLFVLAQEIQLPGAFLEKMELLFSILWLLMIIPLLALQFYLAALSLAEVIALPDHKSIGLVLLPALYLFALLAPNQVLTNQLLNFLLVGQVLTAFVIPLLVYLLWRWKR